jgi:hypothetical protein
MKGSCIQSSGDCQLEGTSQGITNIITPAGAISSTVKPFAGYNATLFFSLGFGDEVGHGNFTFGTHQASHTLALRPGLPLVRVRGWGPGQQIASGSYIVAGGTGIFNNTFGVVMISAVYRFGPGEASCFTHGMVYPVQE